MAKKIRKKRSRRVGKPKLPAAEGAELAELDSDACGNLSGSTVPQDTDSQGTLSPEQSENEWEELVGPSLQDSRSFLETLDPELGLLACGDKHKVDLLHYKDLRTTTPVNSPNQNINEEKSSTAEDSTDEENEGISSLSLEPIEEPRSINQARVILIQNVGPSSGQGLPPAQLECSEPSTNFKLMFDDFLRYDQTKLRDVENAYFEQIAKKSCVAPAEASKEDDIDLFASDDEAPKEKPAMIKLVPKPAKKAKGAKSEKTAVKDAPPAKANNEVKNNTAESETEKLFQERLTQVDGLVAQSEETDMALASKLSALELENKQLKKVTEDLKGLILKLEGRVSSLEGGKPAPAAAQPKQEDDDDLDLFGSDDEEADAEKERITAERLKAYAEKKSKKPVIIAKTSVLLDVKPWDDETDMKAMLESVKSIQMDGLLWGANKLVPIGYGINKLQIMCTVEDDKVSIEELSEKIEALEDLVQSVDVSAMNKI